MAPSTRVWLLLLTLTGCVRHQAAASTSAPAAVDVSALSGLDGSSAAPAETAPAVETARAPSPGAKAYANLGDACQDPDLVDLAPPGSCRVEPLYGQPDLALLRIGAWEETFVRLAVRAHEGWRVGACKAMIDTSVSSLHSVVDDLRGAAVLDDRHAGAFRYVRHVQDLEPQGVGPNGNGDSSKVRESSVYEDHLVEVDFDAGSCADTTVFTDPQRDRVVEFERVRGRHVPRGWHASLQIVADQRWGFRLGER